MQLYIADRHQKKVYIADSLARLHAACKITLRRYKQLCNDYLLNHVPRSIASNECNSRDPCPPSLGSLALCSLVLFPCPRQESLAACWLHGVTHPLTRVHSTVLLSCPQQGEPCWLHGVIHPLFHLSAQQSRCKCYILVITEPPVYNFSHII